HAHYRLRAVPLPAEPDAARPPLDLVVLTDISAGTDATHLQLARTTVEALLRHLDEQDRILVAGSDLDLHRPGAPASAREAARLVAATRTAVDQMLDALARQGTGGATDLGATLAQAVALLGTAGGPGGKGSP